MTRSTIKAIGAFAALSLATTGTAFAQKPIVSTKDPVKTQVRVKESPSKLDVKAPGTGKVTVKPTKIDVKVPAVTKVKVKVPKL